MKKKTSFVRPILFKEPYLDWEKFHAKTKIKKWEPMLPIKDWPKSWVTTYFKDYPRLDKIVLPSPMTVSGISVEELLMKRQSVREFSQVSPSLEQLGSLLYWSAGLRDNKPPWVGNRFYPSPGGRYTLEVYIISQHSDLPTGIYHYNLRSHSLEVLLELKKFSNRHYFNQPWTEKAPIIILFTGVFQRNIIKYGDRGYRHVLEEAGHLGQNFYLLGNAFNLAICAIGGYLDDDLNKLLDVDGLNETVIYALAIGNKS